MFGSFNNKILLPSKVGKPNPLIILIFILIPAALYFPVAGYDFSPFDDPVIIETKLDYYRDSNNFKNILTHTIFEDRYYRPVLAGSFFLDVWLGSGSPGFFHISNLVFHIFTVILLYILLNRLRLPTSVQIAAPLIFAIHPANSMAVCWIPGRNDILLAIPLILSLMLMMKYLSTGKGLWFYGHIMFFFVAMLSKENAVIAPGIFFLWLWLFKHKYHQRFYRTVPLLWWISVLVFWFILNPAPSVQLTPMKSASVMTQLHEMILAVLMYAGKWLLPLHLAIRPSIDGTHIAQYLILPAVVLGSFPFLKIRNKKLFFLGCIWFVGFIIIPVWLSSYLGVSEHFEHRGYVPFLGLTLAIAQLRLKSGYVPRPAYVMLSLIPFLVYFTVFTSSRIPAFKDELSFSSKAVSDTPGNVFAHSLHGHVCLNADSLAKAELHLSIALKLDPESTFDYNLLGLTYFKAELYERALDQYNLALKYDPGNTDALLNRASALYFLQDFDAAAGDLWKTAHLGLTVDEKLAVTIFKARSEAGI